MIRAFTTAMILLAVLATGFAVVMTRHQSRKVFVELQALETRRDELNIEWGRLQLEQATWAETGRIERVARERLGLVAKEPQQVMVIVQ
jgi:cell division protein FtsL